MICDNGRSAIWFGSAAPTRCGYGKQIPLAHAEWTQPTKVKVVGTFHVPFTRSSSKSWMADGTAERACYFCQLCLNGYAD
jgi:hypothetical protein